MDDLRSRISTDAVSILQLELQLLYALLNFSLSWIYAAYQKPPALLGTAPPNIVPNEVPPELATFFDKKKGIAFPTWTTLCEKAAPALSWAAKCAIAYLAAVQSRLPTLQKQSRGPLQSEVKRVAMEPNRVEEVEKEISEVLAFCFDRSESRVQIVVQHTQVLFTEIEEFALTTKTRMQTWMTAQHQAECAAAAALFDYASDKANNGLCLPTSLKLQVLEALAWLLYVEEYSEVADGLLIPAFEDNTDINEHAAADQTSQVACHPDKEPNPENHELEPDMGDIATAA
eukprot:jgi/Botrbrau1/12639/Bobra.67_1s0005.1